MKRLLENHQFSLVLALCLELPCFSQDESFDNGLTLKGSIEGNTLTASECIIEVKAREVVISPTSGDEALVVPATKAMVDDFVMMSDASAAALHLVRVDRKSRESIVVTVNNRGETRSIKSDSFALGKNDSWFIELGGVSSNGDSVLLKAATFSVNPDQEINYVRHRWVILSFVEESWEIVEKEFALERWSKFVRD